MVIYTQKEIDGKHFGYAYSNANMKIQSVSGAKYDNVVYPLGAERVYTETDEPIEGDESMKYSKLAIKRKLDYMHKWDMVKNLITEFGYWDDFLLASYISADDPMLIMIRKAVVEHGIIAEQTMDELLAECLWTAE